MDKMPGQSYLPGDNKCQLYGVSRPRYPRVGYIQLAEGGVCLTERGMCERKYRFVPNGVHGTFSWREYENE
jgi:hypothetical protein